MNSNTILLRDYNIYNVIYYMAAIDEKFCRVRYPKKVSLSKCIFLAK